MIPLPERSLLARMLCFAQRELRLLSSSWLFLSLAFGAFAFRGQSYFDALRAAPNIRR